MKITAFLSCSSTFLLFIVCLVIPAGAHDRGGKGNAEETEGIRRSHFPDGFLFGVSTSAYQTEGAILEDGKGLSDWDVFVHSSGGNTGCENLNNGDTGDIANDHYHRYMEDINLIHSLGVDAYRFSISWPRILPSGIFGDVNAAGIKFYNAIIDNLLLKGIKPFVTIHHGDLPQELQDRYGGWLSPLIQEDFVHFAKTCFQYFGDRVKFWITINEPNLVSKMAFEKGLYPPGHCCPPSGNRSSYTEPLIAMHNMLLAHAKASKLYHEEFQPKQGGVIGIVANIYMFEPLSDNEQDKEAASLALVFNAAWTFDPVVFGDYPPEVRQYRMNELPRFTSEERLIIRDSADFLGINHYGTLYARDCKHPNCDCSDPGCVWCDSSLSGRLTITSERDGILIGDPTGMIGSYVVPKGMGELVEYTKNRYHNKPIFITENGYAPPHHQPEQVDDLQNDVKRIEYHKAYIASLGRAMRNGADVRGYFIWTLMDDYEWVTGYGLKFGLYSVDRKTLERCPRTSAKWYKDFLTNVTFNGAIKPRTPPFSLRSKHKLLTNQEMVKHNYE